MAWTYCWKCQHPLDQPSFSDAVLGAQVCPDCDTSNDTDEFLRRLVLDEYSERWGEVKQ